MLPGWHDVGRYFFSLWFFVPILLGHKSLTVVTIVSSYFYKGFFSEESIDTVRLTKPSLLCELPREVIHPLNNLSCTFKRIH